jgi:cytochrome c7-like protein
LGRIRILASAVAVAAVGAVLWGVLLALSPRKSMGALDTNPGAAATPSEVFTPAHRTFADAWRDFFNRRPEPVQPIAYTHQVHLVKVGMQCTFCHVGVDTGPDARIPGVQVCMTCHQAVATDNPEIKKVAAYLARGEEIPWQRVYGFSPYAHVKFNHAPHIRASVDCKVCHGDMTQVTVARRSVDMTMGFCIDCHKSKGASIDCTTCHF